VNSYQGLIVAVWRFTVDLRSIHHPLLLNTARSESQAAHHHRLNLNTNMTDSWPHWIVNSFASSNRPQFYSDENVYYGPYNRLLYHLFGFQGPFEVSPQYRIPQYIRGDAFDAVSPFIVQFVDSNNELRPVFFIDVKPPASFGLDTNRKQADDEMRNHFRDLRPKLVTPKLPGISAFGTRLAFYEYEATTNILTPHAIVPDPVILNDVAPAERWSYDILEPNGIAQLHEVVQDVKAMCQALLVKDPNN
jgi:hypothetical protein